MILEEELVVHLFAPLEGPGAETAYQQVRKIWRAGRTQLGLAHPIPGVRYFHDLPVDPRSLPDEEVLAGAQSHEPAAERQVILRRLRDVLNVSVALAQPERVETVAARARSRFLGGQPRSGGLGWEQLAQLWDRACSAGTDALLSQERVYLATVPRRSAPDAGTLPELGSVARSRLPYHEDRAPGWSERGGMASGFGIWDTGLPGGPGVAREIVVVAPSDQDAQLSVLTWSDGSPRLPLLGRYLLHSSRLRYQAQLLRDWEQAGRGGLTDDSDELRADSDPPRSGQPPIEELWARIERLRERENTIIRIRADLETMHRTAEIALENMGLVQSAIGLRAPGPESIFGTDRRLGEWLSKQLEHELEYLRIDLGRLGGARGATEQELAMEQRRRPAGTAPTSVSGGQPVSACAGEAFVVYAHENDEHKEMVLKFTGFLRSERVDAQLDRYFEGPRQDWDAWAGEQIKRSKFVIVICSESCRKALEPGSPIDRYRGIRNELGLIRNLLNEDYRAGQAKVLPVVLPPYSVADIPEFMLPYCQDRYEVKALTRAAAADLLAALRGEQSHPRPPVGRPDPDPG